ncbi:HAD-IIIA family hydrolase [Opitutus sp. ER46]|uniref:KdsC family phosphatase n=1 Tax=Opitutus sp. ER46 TaxID=2161864 RepID=UPI000D31592B|nr:HAD-IIIA family hydrolase [Opitutus sp. ER46]PTX97712.1 HAD family hydrolase [Opitutus sp. ER46]
MASPKRSASRSAAAAPARADWARVRLFAMDVDGVLTDGTVLISSDGTEAKSFSILDGMGLRQLGRAGVAVAWISGRPSKATTRRARELEIPFLMQGRTDKLTALLELADELGLKAANCAYMGDDVIDAPAIAWAGVGIAPPGAMPAAQEAATYLTQRPAGLGAVREVCDHILTARLPRVGNRQQRAQTNRK